MRGVSSLSLRWVRQWRCDDFAWVDAGGAWSRGEAVVVNVWGGQTVDDGMVREAVKP